MPFKKGHRNSWPARVNNATLTPSRRSPRVPTPSKSMTQTTRSAKAVDMTTNVSPTNNSHDFQHSTSKSPSTDFATNMKQKNASKDSAVTRRQTFQARPTRLSTVYTPTKEVQDSILQQESRKTRRTAALEISNDQASDQELRNGLDTTGMAMAQYARHNFTQNNSVNETSPTGAYSGTRLSARPRKPTTRAIEALHSEKKPRQKRTPAATEPVEEPPTEDVMSSRMKMVRQGIKRNRANKVFKQKKKDKSSLLKIKLNPDDAGKKLYEIVLVALSTDFVLPSDPENFIADKRKQFEELTYSPDSASASTSVSTSVSASVSALSNPADTAVQVENAGETHAETNGETNHDTTTTTPDEINNENFGLPSIKDLQKMKEPQVESDGWTLAGYVNESGEEVILTAPDHTPYRAPHTYADENLPFPPVTSRSAQEIEMDLNLGFPPLFGDRNIPFCTQSEFSQEDVSEEKARSNMHKRKRSEAESDKLHKAKKQQTLTKLLAKQPPTEDEKPVVQRLKLKLKPPTEADKQAGAVTSPVPGLTSNPRKEATRGKSRGQSRGSIRSRGRGGTARGSSTRGVTKTRGTARGSSIRGGSSRGTTVRGQGRGRGRG